MKEASLRDLLIGALPPEDVFEDLSGAYRQEARDVRGLRVEAMGSSLVVTKEMMLRVLDHVLGLRLPPAVLEPIGDCLLMSQNFVFEPKDADLLEDVANHWGSPEVDGPHTQESASRSRDWLLTGSP